MFLILFLSLHLLRDSPPNKNNLFVYSHLSKLPPYLANLFSNLNSSMLVESSSLDMTLLPYQCHSTDFGFCQPLIHNIGGLVFLRCCFANPATSGEFHTSTESEHQKQRGLLQDIVVAKESIVSQLLSREDKSLLVRWKSLLVLYLQLNYLSRLGSFYIQSDCFTRRSVNKNLKGLAIRIFWIFFW